MYNFTFSINCFHLKVIFLLLSDIKVLSFDLPKQGFHRSIDLYHLIVDMHQWVQSFTLKLVLFSLFLLKINHFFEKCSFFKIFRKTEKRGVFSIFIFLKFCIFLVFYQKSCFLWFFIIFPISLYFYIYIF